MESQLQRQDGHNGYEEEPRHSVVEGEGESEGKGEVEGVHHHGEKKSVLTKVKDKAKKIKDAIKKHGHGHDHGHNLEEEEEDEQMMDDPQVHGSPMLDSTVIGSVNLGQRITPGQTGVNIEKPTESHEDGFNRNVRDDGVTPVGLRDNMGRTTAMETDEGRATARETAQFAFGKVADSPVMGREEANVGQTRVNIGQSVHSPSGAIPPSNYQSKVVDPTGTGGEEADVAPLVGEFDKMNVLDQTDSKSKPESESELSKIRTSSYPENPESTLKRLDPGKTEDMPCDTLTGKLSYATSAIADKAATSAIADSPVVGREEANVGQTKVKIGQSVHSPSEAISPSNYQSKVVDPKGTGGEEADVAPLVGEFDKMNVLDQTDSKSKSESESSKIRTSSCPENPESILKRLDPGKTEDMPRDTVSGNLSYATSAIADTAVTSAIADSPVVGREEANMGQTKVKIGQSVHSPSEAIPPSNYQSKVVDPKGTGGEEADVAPLVGDFDQMNVLDQTDSKSKSESESSKIRTSSCPENPESTLKRLDPGKTEDMPRDTVTGKLSYATSAIADKAISAKNATASKLGYGGHEEGQDSQKATSESAQSVAATMTEKSALVYHEVVDASSAVMSKVQGSGTLDEGRDRATLVGNEGKGTDKGFSVKDYLAEKFRPGDEDKALSEAMSGALHKKKGETGKPVGEVTESEQMARGLGTGSENKREGEDVLSAGNESKGAGMVDRIKDAVGSWLGGSSGMQTSQDSLAQSNVSDTVTTPTPTPTPTRNS